MYNYVLEFNNAATLIQCYAYQTEHILIHFIYFIFHFIIKNFLIDSNCLFSFFCCRILLAVLLKHHDLGHAALAIVEQGDHSKHSVPKSISELFKVVSKTKRSLIQVSLIHVLNE